MTTTQTTRQTARTGRSLIEPNLFARLSTRIATEHDTDTATAERIMDQALAYLGACAVTTAPLSPSKQVDIGWHTFILYTRDYAQFCEHIAGRFIHHVPTDDETATTHAAAPWETTASIVAAGFIVDAPLWEDATKCSQCHNGCNNDPAPNPSAL